MYGFLRIEQLVIVVYVIGFGLKLLVLHKILYIISFDPKSVKLHYHLQYFSTTISLISLPKQKYGKFSAFQGILLYFYKF